MKAEQRRQIKNALMWLRESVRQPLDLNVNRSVLQCAQHNTAALFSCRMHTVPLQAHLYADAMRGCHLHNTELAQSPVDVHAEQSGQTCVVCVLRVKVLERLHRLRQVLLANT